MAMIGLLNNAMGAGLASGNPALQKKLQETAAKTVATKKKGFWGRTIGAMADVAGNIEANAQQDQQPQRQAGMPAWQSGLAGMFGGGGGAPWRAVQPGQAEELEGAAADVAGSIKGRMGHGFAARPEPKSEAPTADRGGAYGGMPPSTYQGPEQRFGRSIGTMLQQGRVAGASRFSSFGR